MSTNEPMPQGQLDAIQRRVDATTSGPWCHWSGWDQTDNCVSREDMHTVAEVISESDDARFIAHAREDVPDLLAEVHRLRAELAKAREVAREKLDDATYAVASAHHPFSSGCLCGYKSARKRDVTEHILDQFIAALGGGDDA